MSGPSEPTVHDSGRKGGGSLVCRQCGGRSADEQDLNCPADGGWYVVEDGLARHNLDPFLGSALDGKYPLIKVLGEGGFGTVYLARQLAEGKALRDVAVKTVRTGGAVDREEATGRFRREAAAIARLNHPNIVQLYDFGVTDDGVFYMVLELVQGRTLSDAFEGRELFTPERIGRIFRQVLQGLAAAHDAGMVHRDLKPDNLMLVRTAWEPDHVKVLDFGLAKIVGGADAMKLSRTNTAYGTVHYMAPEQVVGSKVDARADLYPVGVMLYQIYAGFRPFDAESAPIVMFQHVHRDVPELPDTVPIGIRSLIYKSLRKRPSERFGSAMEMLQALDQALARPDVEIPGGERPRGIPRPGGDDPDDPYTDALHAEPPGRATSAPLIVASSLQPVATPPPGSFAAATVGAPSPPPRQAGAGAARQAESRAPSDSAALAAEIVAAHSAPRAPRWRKPVMASVGVGVGVGLLSVLFLLPERTAVPPAADPAAAAAAAAVGKAPPASPAVEPEPAAAAPEPVPDPMGPPADLAGPDPAAADAPDAAGAAQARPSKGPRKKARKPKKEGGEEAVEIPRL